MQTNSFRQQTINRILPYLLAFVSLCCFQCSTSKQIESARKFEIRYYTIGGITGSSEGLTLSSDRWVKFWMGSTASVAVVKDSAKVDEDKLKRISDILNSDSLFNYQSTGTGNISTVLAIRRDETLHTITFSGVVPPETAPSQLKQLLEELNNINK